MPFPTEVQDALERRIIAPRDFLFIRPRNRLTGARVNWGVWSDVGNVNVDVIDPTDGSTVARDYLGGVGDLISISPVQISSGLIVQTVEISMAATSDQVDELFRTHDARRAPVEIHRGFLNPDNMRLVYPAIPRFVGFVDDMQATTGKAGEEGGVTLTAASLVQDLTRTSSSTRSDRDQRLRSPTDGFFRNAALVGAWRINWGTSG